MKACFSVTNNDLYLFFMPIVAWTWHQIGVDCVVMYVTTDKPSEAEDSRFILAGNYMPEETIFEHIRVDSKEQEATYSQVSRLYAACLPEIPDDEVLMTADADMAVFGPYLLQGNTDAIQIFGHDLVDEGQYPICYISMPTKTWQQVMGITPGYGVQHYLDQFLQPKVCEHMRGNYWALDQETINNKLQAANLPIIKHPRANLPHRFATRRADRDSWPQHPLPDTIDCHLLRPGYKEENFEKILALIQEMYPAKDLGWMREYRDHYVKLP